MTFTIEIRDDDAAALAELARRCSEGGAFNMTTHGALDTAALLRLLIEDAALVVRRPGSWEAAGIAALLSKHGYDM